MNVVVVLDVPPEHQRQLVTPLESRNPGQTLVHFFEYEFAWLAVMNVWRIHGWLALVTQSLGLRLDKAPVTAIEDALAYVSEADDGGMCLLFPEHAAHQS